MFAAHFAFPVGRRRRSSASGRARKDHLFQTELVINAGAAKSARVNSSLGRMQRSVLKSLITVAAQVLLSTGALPIGGGASQRQSLAAQLTRSLNASVARKQSPVIGAQPCNSRSHGTLVLSRARRCSRDLQFHLSPRQEMPFRQPPQSAYFILPPLPCPLMKKK